MIDFNQLKKDWLAKENRGLIERRRRRYFHFDKVLDGISPAIFKKITSPSGIESHAFLPLMKRIQKDRFYKKDPITKKRFVKPKERPISYASHLDASVYSWYACQLEARYEEGVLSDGISDSVLAYRKLGKSNLQFAREVFEFIERQGSCVAIAVDIKGFYDSLDHRLLKSEWCKVLGGKDLPSDHYKVYRSITSAATVSLEGVMKMLGLKKRDREELRQKMNVDLLERMRNEGRVEVNKTGVGIPQGTPISCVLSNMYMREFDIAMRAFVAEHGGIYRRYSDDIIVVCPITRKKDVLDKLSVEIEKRKLIIQSEKTEIRIFQRPSEGFLVCTDDRGKPAALQYLGVSYDGARMLLRHKGYAKFGRRMVRAVRREVIVANELKMQVAKRKLYERFTPLGIGNYVTYVRRAAKELRSPALLGAVTMQRLSKKINDRLKKERI